VNYRYRQDLLSTLREDDLMNELVLVKNSSSKRSRKASIPDIKIERLEQPEEIKEVQDEEGELEEFRQNSVKKFQEAFGVQYYEQLSREQRKTINALNLPFPRMQPRNKANRKGFKVRSLKRRPSPVPTKDNSPAFPTKGGFTTQ